MKTAPSSTLDFPTITSREVELHKRIARLQREQLETELELRRIRSLLSDAYTDKLRLMQRGQA